RLGAAARAMPRRPWDRRPSRGRRRAPKRRRGLVALPGPDCAVLGRAYNFRAMDEPPRRHSPARPQDAGRRPNCRKISRDELAHILELHRVYLDQGRGSGQRADLRAADLTGLDLAGANLRRARMSHALLDDADLTGADLSKANLIGAGLARARLVEVDLTGAR